jgi:TonB family protein
MRNVTFQLTVLASLLYAATSQADCARPRPDFQVPDGTASTQQELTAAKEALVKFDRIVGDYLRCLEGEASQKTVGKDAAARTKLNSEYVTAYNTAADELAGLAMCYNAQVQASAKATPPAAAGSTGKQADCSSFIKAAGSRSAASNEPAPNGIVKEADGFTTDLEDGAWSYTLLRDDQLRLCKNKVECLQRIVYIRNSSPRTLECKASITYEGTDVEGRASLEGKAVISGKSGRPVVTSLAARNVNAKTFEAQCTPRADLPPLSTPATCKYQVIKPISIGDYYPDASRNLGEEGPVTLEFQVGDKPASPSDVKVVASSLFPALDAAAIKAVQAMVMSSNCKSGRHRLRLSFQLQ